mmetsp:Transcript_21649/g.54551  ORF Transcript_21649/g.54551 Transcript_21649/m.54551 type:complete len:275 (+) Transcript_21649:117-941(+)
MAVSSNGALLASAAAGRELSGTADICIWNTDTGICSAVLSYHPSAVQAVAFTQVPRRNSAVDLRLGTGTLPVSEFSAFICLLFPKQFPTLLTEFAAVACPSGLRVAAVDRAAPREQCGGVGRGGRQDRSCRPSAKVFHRRGVAPRGGARRPRVRDAGGGRGDAVEPGADAPRAAPYRAPGGAGRRGPALPRMLGQSLLHWRRLRTRVARGAGRCRRAASQVPHCPGGKANLRGHAHHSDRGCGGTPGAGHGGRTAHLLRALRQRAGGLGARESP